MVTSANNGFSLIEVLISVFVLTIGVIAASGLHLTALRTSQQSAFQTTAMHLAVEMAESMRAGLIMLAAEVATPALDDACADGMSDAPASCNASQSSLDEMGTWLQRVSHELPAGQARICRDASPWDVGSGQLSWTCSAPSAVDDGPFVIKIGWHDKASRDEKLPDAPRLALVVQPMPR